MLNTATQSIGHGSIGADQRFFELIQPLRDLPLLGRREKVRPRRNEEALETLIQQFLLLLPEPDSRIELSELRVDVRQKRLVVLAAELNHVIERVEARLPGGELLSEVLEVEIVLQRRLEVVGRHELRQVIGFGRIGQRSQTNHPSLVLANFFPHQRFQKLAVSHAFDRRVQLV